MVLIPSEGQIVIYELKKPFHVISVVTRLWPSMSRYMVQNYSISTDQEVGVSAKWEFLFNTKISFSRHELHIPSPLTFNSKGLSQYRCCLTNIGIRITKIKTVSRPSYFTMGIQYMERQFLYWNEANPIYHSSPIPTIIESSIITCGSNLTKQQF